MSIDILVTKEFGGFLVPADEESTEAINTIKNGQGVRLTMKKIRNVGFHQKYFALLNLAYDAWEPMAEYKGEKVQKNFDQFRNDITVLAGFSEATVTLRNEIRFKAKSISFGSMSQEDFEILYSRTIDVILSRILTNYTKDDLDNVVSNILGFS